MDDRCSADGRISARLVGARARAHKASGDADITRRAKAGFSPCCAKPAHIAVPSRHPGGEFSA